MAEPTEKKPWDKLTDRQRQVYTFIRSEMEGKGLPPTVREIGEHIGITSPNGVISHLRALERYGWIVRVKNISRGILLTEALDAGSVRELVPVGTTAGVALGDGSSTVLQVLGLESTRGIGQGTVKEEQFTSTGVPCGATVLVDTSRPAQVGERFASRDPDFSENTVYCVRWLQEVGEGEIMCSMALDDDDAEWQHLKVDPATIHPVVGIIQQF